MFKNIVAQGNNSTVKTAASELCDAIASMLGFKPALHSKAVAGQRVILGTAETSLFIRKHADDLRLNRIQEDGFIIKTVDLGHTKALVIAGAVPAGVTFGTFDPIRRLQLGQDPGKLNVLENPQIPLRMVDHWSYFRGGFGDKWRGGGRNDSIYSWEELRTGDTKRIRDWVRMMASAGWNAICPSEVNWHYMDNYLDHLDEVEILAGLLSAQRAVYEADTEAATKLIEAGDSMLAEGHEPSALAAWTVVSSAILNLHEAITKG